MRKLHVKTYDIESKTDHIVVTLNGLVVAEWCPVSGLTCVNSDTRVNENAIAHACAEEWVRPSNAMREPVPSDGASHIRKPRSWDAGES